MMEAEGQQWPCKTDFYMQLPKVELHAHLNGSISASTMKKLIAKKPHLNVHSHMTMIDKGKKRTLEECFQMFQVIHQLTTNAEDILMCFSVYPWLSLELTVETRLAFNSEIRLPLPPDYGNSSKHFREKVSPVRIWWKTQGIPKQLAQEPEARALPNTQVTKDVIKEFADDGVKYLELRSTPRGENATGMTKRTYVESILEGIKQCKQENLDIDVRYLMAIDRRGGPRAAKETVELAKEFFLSAGDTVLGLDLSGDPTVGQAGDFLEPLLEAKKAGLKLALHLAEIPDNKKETQMLLDLLPDRIGHGTFLNSSVGGSLDQLDFVRQHRIPLELCLTSNIKSQTVPSYEQHHFGFWYSIAHPSVICTDDKGVFATYLSQEYQLAAETFNLTPSQVWDLSYESINYIFASDNTRAELRKRWNHLKPKVLHF